MERVVVERKPVVYHGVEIKTCPGRPGWFSVEGTDNTYRLEAAKGLVDIRMSMLKTMVLAIEMGRAQK